jgi:heterodisulfide reductase subunit A
MDERIGVFICDCGTNISDNLDTEELCRFAAAQDGVVDAHIHRLLCSEEGCADLAETIKAKNLTHVVAAACSPKQHEKTFQKAMIQAGVNPFMLVVVNIREQIAWVTPDRAEATQKAIVQLDAGIRRVKRQTPLDPSVVDCNTDFLVIGAGVAGMIAALTLAQKGRKVTLVERSPWIGGKVVAYEDVFPDMECAPCMLEPLMDHVLHNERITVMTNTVVENIRGFFGNFEATVRTKARYVIAEACMGCSACYDPCPVTTKNAADGNLSDRHAIYTPFPGALPNVPAVDWSSCVRSGGEECTACQEACFFGAIDFSQEDTVDNISVGAVIVATGFEEFDASAIKNFSVGTPNVLSAYQFERMLCREGSTGGRVLTASGEAPKSIAFVHCVGSRDSRHKAYCSSTCCANTLKLIHLARKRMEDAPASVYEFYSDWCLSGKGYQEFHDSVKGEGTKYIRVENPNDIRVRPEDGRLSVEYDDGCVVVDMVVLAVAMVPAEGSKELAEVLGLSLDRYGFFAPEHDRISPASTRNRGIYVAGCASGPKDIPQSVLQGQAAAGLALSALVPGEKLELESAVSVVNEKLCGACRVCVPLCPYQAIAYDPERDTAFVNNVLCRGCGVCAAACPSGAMSNRHFTDAQIFAEIEGVLR